MNYPSGSDVPSWSFRIITHTNSAILIDTTTPYHAMSQHLRRLPYCSKFYHHHCAAFWHPLRISELLHNAISPLPSCFPRNHCFVHSQSSLASCTVTLSPWSTIISLLQSIWCIHLDIKTCALGWFPAAPAADKTSSGWSFLGLSLLHFEYQATIDFQRHFHIWLSMLQRAHSPFLIMAWQELGQFIPGLLPCPYG